ncbi:CGNR zinc finger domain-containing protein [Actinoallomurus acaciae]|uniref:CGNR zinc finger domain-containing protein n=1 Tax=Actinoallomurus acaciae TaxID=502577 RepID=A0ABV5YGX8_9ACTN
MVEAMPLDTLVELINGWGTDPRREDGRSDQPYPPAADIEERLGARPGDRVLAEVADRLHPVFAVSDPAERARLVTRLLADTGVRPALGAEAGRLYSGWLVADERDAVLASAAVALREYLAGHDSHRLGMCADLRCADVYIDTSPGGRRRFCSVTCQNRTRVAAFRSRRAQG